MTFIDPLNIQDVRTGALAPSTWGDTVRGDLEFLIERPMCDVFATAYRSITSGGSYPIAMSNYRYDTDGMHSNTTNNSRITIQTRGLYAIGGLIVYQSGAGGYRKLQFVYNGTTTDEVQVIRGGAGFESTLWGTVLYPFEAGEYIVMHASHDFGSNLDVIAVNFNATMICEF